MIAHLQATMADDVGPIRTGLKLSRALDDIAALAAELGERPPPRLPSPASGGGNSMDPPPLAGEGREGAPSICERLDWFDLRNMLVVARAVAATALARTESRGAHQREDFPDMLPQWQVNQRVRLSAGELQISGAPAAPAAAPDAASAAKVLHHERRRHAQNLARQTRDAGRWESYEVPFEPGQSVLDGLRWVRIHKDPTLAIRFSCINANACKECMMQFDGETVYACTARLEPREMTLAPLPNKKLVRDLVTEIAPPSERFNESRTCPRPAPRRA